VHPNEADMHILHNWNLGVDDSNAWYAPYRVH